jgi:hypothetical protein
MDSQECSVKQELERCFTSYQAERGMRQPPPVIRGSSSRFGKSPRQEAIPIPPRSSMSPHGI